MKRRTILALCLGLALAACQEAREDLKNPVSEKDIYQKIGEEIPFETGMQWIAFHREKYSIQGRSDLSSIYSVPAPEMNAMLDSTSGLTGVAFHYALDDNGVKHVILIPVDETLDLWGGSSNRTFIDANTGTAIDYSVAFSWAENFKRANPDTIWFHFFGKDIFDQMRALPYYQSVNIEPATSTIDLTPQLLLVVLNYDQISIGRTQTASGTVYDASNACPPCAAK